MQVNVLQYLDNAAECFADKTAFAEDSLTITFKEFRQRVQRKAYGILQRFGKGIQHRPIVMMQQKGIDELVNFMAVAWTGNIYVPFDSGAPHERLNKMLEILEPFLIITDTDNQQKAKELISDAEIVLTESLDWEGMVDEEVLMQVRRGIIDTDPLYIICTSGSTGVPKGVVVSHRAVIDFTEEASEKMQFSSSEQFISQVPFYFDVSVLDIYCTLRNASTLHIVPAYFYTFPAKVMQYIEQNQINALIWVPSALVMVANLEILDEVDVTCLNKIMFCGEVMPSKQLNIWRKAVPEAQYVNYYGPAETTCASTYYIIDREFADDEPLPIGKPAYNTGILILNEGGQSVSSGEIGELYIKGSGLALGYYKNPEKTREVFLQNPLNESYLETVYRTGDLVKINEYGELMYMGRKDFQIKHMGYRIELGEIETAVNSLPDIQMSCCLYDDEKKKIVLVCQGALSDKEILNFLKEKIPQYMLPQAVILMERMPLNANGKIDRTKLKEIIGR